MMEIEELKKVGSVLRESRTHTSVQDKVLQIVKKETKKGNSVTQKEVSEKLGKMLNRNIRPQQSRSCLMSLLKKNKVERFELGKPDKDGNSVFWTSK